MKQGKNTITPRGRPKPTLEEIKRVLQYLDEEMLVEGTFQEVCEFVNQLKEKE